MLVCPAWRWILSEPLTPELRQSLGESQVLVRKGEHCFDSAVPLQ